MRHDPNQVVVTGADPATRSTPSACRVHHREFPELQVEGDTAREGVERLSRQLIHACDWLCDPWRRDAISAALSDVDAYLGYETSSQA